MNISVVILAAGEGTRMRSALPKVLHPLAGKPLLAHVIETAKQLTNDVTVIYGFCGKQVKAALADLKVNWVEQKQQLGTGHAVLQALPNIPADNRVLVLYGDVPLISLQTLKAIIDRTPKDSLGWLTAEIKNPQNLGRIIRDKDNNPIAIIEEQDASETQKTVNEINTGICIFPAKYLKEWLPNLKNKNSQNEYYLTEVFAVAIKNGIDIVTISPQSNIEIQGVNNKIELAKLERAYQVRQARTFLEQGVTILDPKRFDLRGKLIVGKDVTIDVNVIIEGKVTIGSNCHIGANTILRNVNLGNGVVIDANSILEEAEVADNCTVGPFARLRPGTKLQSKAKVGNFVEVKKSIIGSGSKVNHLSYVGDATIGAEVNVGAGTITCNYDGVNKHHTIIEDGAFICSNTALVAPVIIGKNVTVGAGSTINRDVPAEELAIARAKQVNITGWKRPTKKEKAKG